MSTDDSRDEELALETIAAAAKTGVTVFDTARAYGRGADELGHNEALLARGLRRCGAEPSARVVTKGGMSRKGGGWAPDGRARAIRADCEASLAALDGLAVDLYLLHAPDPRTPWRTSLRALARLLDEGMVRRIGLGNVNRGQLDEALTLTEIAAVQVALSPSDDSALRSGMLEHCAEAGVTLIAHSPLGGPRRVRGLARHLALAAVAERRGATAAEVALAWLLELSPSLVAIPGARRPETARSAARAATLRLESGDRAVLAQSLGWPRPSRHLRARHRTDADVVLVMGIPGAGKSRIAAEHVARGYVRLNRDDRGGSLRALAGALDERLAAGVGRIVLDNTYLTRAARSHVIDAASRHRVPARCIWVDTPLGAAQVNLVERLLERFGALPAPEEVRELARHEPGILGPTSQMRALRELEPPSTEEGLAGVERVPFVRAQSTASARAGVFVAAGALSHPGWTHALERADRSAPHLVFDWKPDGRPDALADWVARVGAEVSGPVASALCPHAAGPPSCWCRPPLPGLPLAFAREHGVAASRSIVIGAAPAHRTLATALGAGYIPV